MYETEVNNKIKRLEQTNLFAEKNHTYAKCFDVYFSTWALIKL